VGTLPPRRRTGAGTFIDPIDLSDDEIQAESVKAGKRKDSGSPLRRDAAKLLKTASRTSAIPASAAQDFAGSSADSSNNQGDSAAKALNNRRLASANIRESASNVVELLDDEYGSSTSSSPTGIHTSWLNLTASSSTTSHSIIDSLGGAVRDVKQENAMPQSVPLPTMRRIIDLDQDYMLALQLQKEEEAGMRDPVAMQADEDLAQQLLHEEEVQRLQVAVNEKMRMCMVCSDDKSIFQFPAKPPTSKCIHPVNTCQECLQTWIESELDSKGWDRITCMECSATMHHNDVQQGAAPNTFMRFDALSARAALGTLDEFIWCINPGCTSGQCHPAGVDAPIFVCNACGFRHCIAHRVKWHDGETCQQYDYRSDGGKRREAEEKASEVTVGKMSKCPKCSSPIEKKSGCDHMTCKPRPFLARSNAALLIRDSGTRCRTEFCYLCSASFKEIRRIGNTAHKETCAYHSKNVGVTGVRYPH